MRKCQKHKARVGLRRWLAKVFYCRLVLLCRIWNDARVVELNVMDNSTSRTTCKPPTNGFLSPMSSLSLFADTTSSIDCTVCQCCASFINIRMEAPTKLVPEAVAIPQHEACSWGQQDVQGLTHSHRGPSWMQYSDQQVRLDLGDL